jgi:hypothetical protein
MAALAAGAWITEWAVGIANFHMQLPSGVVLPVASMFSLQGKTSDGSWLPEVKSEGTMANIRSHRVVVEGAEEAGFAKLHGQGSGWLTTFMDSPTQIDTPWEVDSARLQVPYGRVVGYQLRTAGFVDSARFLFRSFPPEGEAICSSVGIEWLVVRWELIRGSSVGDQWGLPDRSAVG